MTCGCRPGFTSPSVVVANPFRRITFDRTRAYRMGSPEKLILLFTNFRHTGAQLTPGGFEPPLPDRKSGVLDLTRRWGLRRQQFKTCAGNVKREMRPWVTRGANLRRNGAVEEAWSGRRVL